MFILSSSNFGITKFITYLGLIKIVAQNLYQNQFDNLSKL